MSRTYIPRWVWCSAAAGLGWGVLLPPLACQDPPAQREAARLQNEDGERGCALPGRVQAVACNEYGCLVCYEVGGVPREEQAIPMPSVCLSMSVGGCQ